VGRQGRNEARPRLGPSPLTGKLFAEAGDCLTPATRAKASGAIATTSRAASCRERSGRPRAGGCLAPEIERSVAAGLRHKINSVLLSLESHFQPPLRRQPSRDCFAADCTIRHAVCDVRDSPQRRAKLARVRGFRQAHGHRRTADTSVSGAIGRFSLRGEVTRAPSPLNSLNRLLSG